MSARDSLILGFFEYVHLDEHFKPVARRFYELAHWIAAELPQGAERSKALAKLLLAKDAALDALKAPT